MPDKVREVSLSATILSTKIHRSECILDSMDKYSLWVSTSDNQIKPDNNCWTRILALYYIKQTCLQSYLLPPDITNITDQVSRNI